ncbi:MAG TPA: hypothetical protein VL492_05405 [Methylovirgula sp.]|jgi:hypothetical protein|nr:hypothetical protein [Methylovirgula sp.]
MRPQPVVLRLGDAEWRVRPLTLKQIQEIEPLLQNGEDAGRSIAAAVKIVGVALSRDHAEAGSKLTEMEATTQEIGDAMRAVLQLGGFIAAREESEPGEEQAGADGISSTPA